MARMERIVWVVCKCNKYKTVCLVVNSDWNSASNLTKSMALKIKMRKLSLQACACAWISQEFAWHLHVHTSAYAILHGESEMLKSKNKWQIYSSDRRRALGLVILTPRTFALNQTKHKISKNLRWPAQDIPLQNGGTVVAADAMSNLSSEAFIVHEE